MKTITLAMALAAALTLPAALPATASVPDLSGVWMTWKYCEDVGGEWVKQPRGSGIVVCVVDGGAIICNDHGQDCVFDPAYRNVIRDQRAPKTAGVATAPQKPRPGVRTQPLFPAVGTFRVR